MGGTEGWRSVQHPEDVRSELQHSAHPVWHGRPCFLQLNVSFACANCEIKALRGGLWAQECEKIHTLGSKKMLLKYIMAGTTAMNHAYALRNEFITYLEANPIPAVHHFHGKTVLAYVAGGSAFNYLFSKNQQLTAPSNWEYLKTPDVDLKFMSIQPLNNRDKRRVTVSALRYMREYLEGFRRWIIPRLGPVPPGVVLSIFDPNIWEYDEERYHENGWADGYTGNYLYSIYGFHVSYPTAHDPNGWRRVQFLDVSIGENPYLTEQRLYRVYPITILHPRYMFIDQAYIIIASFLSRDPAIGRRNPFATVTNAFNEQIRQKGEKDMKRLLLLARHFMGVTTKGYKALEDLYHNFFTHGSINKYRASIHILSNLIKSKENMNINNTSYKDYITHQFMLFIAGYPQTVPSSGDHAYLSGGMGIRVMMAHLNHITGQRISGLNRYMVDRTDDFDFKYMVPHRLTNQTQINTKKASMNQFFEPLFRLFATGMGAHLIINELYPGPAKQVTPAKTMYYVRNYQLQIGTRTYDFADTTLFHDSNFNHTSYIHIIGGIPVLQTPYMLKDTLEVLTRSILAANGSHNSRRNPINGTNALKGYKNLRRASTLAAVLQNNPGVMALLPHMIQLQTHIYNKKRSAARTTARTIRTMLGY